MTESILLTTHCLNYLRTKSIMKLPIILYSIVSTMISTYNIIIIVYLIIITRALKIKTIII